MADVKLNKDHGYGQVELNKVAFRRTGRIEAQCELKPETKDGEGNVTDAGLAQVENGMILAINPVAHTVELPTTTSELLALNYTAEHMYDERNRGLKNFVLKRGEFYPRLGYLEKGDIFTTNTVIYADTYTPVAGGYGHIDAGTGYIRVNATATGALLKIVEITTMPDGAPAIKFIAL